ncbi:MAG: hypothetical protein KGI50_03400 [Patescibacteria group bacterium]|nr:hypothetical protein [Patescibacteria group bacterium]MDE2438337.1 hypothetical protein [Patescibacteria group bacterium]
MEDQYAREEYRHIDEARRDANTKKPEEMIDFLVASLGKDLVRYGIGLASYETLKDLRTDLHHTRLRYLYQAVRVIVGCDGTKIALVWFVGRNDYLDERAPLLVLREAESEMEMQEVVFAAENFVING